MKNLLLTFIVLLFGFNSFSQIDLNAVFANGRYHNSVEDIVNLLTESNPSVAYVKTYDDYLFEDGVRMNFTIFRDEDGKFLDLVFFKKKKDIRWEVKNLSRKHYDLNRKIVDFSTNFNDEYKLVFDDGSYMTIIYDFYRKNKYDGTCSKTRYQLLDYRHKEDKNPNFELGGSMYIEVDCK